MKKAFDMKKAEISPIFACLEKLGNRSTLKLVQGSENKNGTSELYALSPNDVKNVYEVCDAADSLCMKSLLVEDPYWYFY